MSKKITPKQMFKQSMEELFKLQILHGAEYIDARSRGAYRTWVKNRLKKLEPNYIFNKTIWTDMKGNKVTPKN